MIDKNYFQFYETFLQTIEALPTEEQLKYFSAICRYGLFGEQPSFEGKDKAIFLQIQFAIDNQNKRRSINRENVKKRYENLQNSTNDYEVLQNAEVKRNEKNRSGVNVNSRNCPPQPFSFPTLEDVKKFCSDFHLDLVNPEKFFSYYSERNWQNVKDWKSVLMKWNETEYPKKQKDTSDPYAVLR